MVAAPQPLHLAEGREQQPAVVAVLPVVRRKAHAELALQVLAVAHQDLHRVLLHLPPKFLQSSKAACTVLAPLFAVRIVVAGRLALAVHLLQRA
eukprot:4293463-Heterocapsa_arctica.AAC.1